MKWNPILPGLALLLPQLATAVPGAWATDDAIGANQVVYTLTLGCPNPGFVCDLIDGYVEQDTSIVQGSGALDLDDLSDSFSFDPDSSQDVGSGPQPAYLTLTGSDVSFANIPFAGVPEISDLLVFALTNPGIPAAGLDLLTPGDYPFSQTVSYSGTGTVIGDLEFLLGPAIIVPPADVVVSGVLRVLGDLDGNGSVDFELRDVSATFGFQNLTSIAGEPVTVDVTADMTLHLSSPVMLPTAPVPALGPAASVLLAGVMAVLAIVLLERTQRLSARS